MKFWLVEHFCRVFLSANCYQLIGPVMISLNIIAQLLIMFGCVENRKEKANCGFLSVDGLRIYIFNCVCVCADINIC